MLQQPDNRGFSLLEMIVVLSIFLVVSTIVTSFVAQNFRVNRFALEQSDAINQARRGMDIMVRELREASAAENGSFPVDTASDQTLIFYSDIDADALLERVRYFLDGTELKKAVLDPSGFPPVYTGEETINTISQYVRNDLTPIFYYYNKDFPNDTINNPLETPAAVNQIRLVKILLEINVNPAQAPKHFILISNSQLRNLKDNL